MAYRVFTARIYGFLGRGNRVPIPSCVLTAIRETFPDECNEYTGFEWYSGFNSSRAPYALNF